jgi:hypothetical protein
VYFSSFLSHSLGASSLRAPLTSERLLSIPQVTLSVPSFGAQEKNVETSDWSSISFYYICEPGMHGLLSLFPNWALGLSEPWRGLVIWG